MIVYVLMQEFGRHSAVIGVYTKEQKAWDYVERRVEKYGEQEYDYYTVTSTELNK